MNQNLRNPHVDAMHAASYDWLLLVRFFCSLYGFLPNQLLLNRLTHSEVQALLGNVVTRSVQ